MGPVCADEAESFQNALQPRNHPPRALARRDGHQQQADDHRNVTHAVGEEAPAFADGRHRDAGDGGPQNAGAVEHGGIQRDGIDQVFRHHHFDDERLARRNIKRIHHAQQRRQQHDFPHLDVSEQGQRRKDEGEQHRGGLRGNHGAMPAVTVREQSPQGSEEEHRNLPREPHQPQQQRRLGEPIDQPRLRNRLHPGANQRDDLAAEEQPVIAVPQGAEHHGQPRCGFLVIPAVLRAAASVWESVTLVPDRFLIITLDAWEHRKWTSKTSHQNWRVLTLSLEMSSWLRGELFVDWAR